MKIRKMGINEGIVQICVPITSHTKQDIIRDMKEAYQSDANMIEWRVDFFDGIKEIEQVIQLLKEIRVILNDKVLIFTYRSKQEGGACDLQTSEYLLLVKTAVLSKTIDIVDVELLLGDTIINSIVSHAHISDVKVLISNHDFDSTPRFDVIENRINLMYKKGADIAKVAYTPKSKEDVDSLFEVSKSLDKEKPYILISMGELGQVTRLEAKKLGSCVTFASLLNQVSAPGQIDIQELKNALSQ